MGRAVVSKQIARVNRSYVARAIDRRTINARAVAAINRRPREFLPSVFLRLIFPVGKTRIYRLTSFTASEKVFFQRCYDIRVYGTFAAATVMGKLSSFGRMIAQ